MGGFFLFSCIRISIKGVLFLLLLLLSFNG